MAELTATLLPGFPPETGWLLAVIVLLACWALVWAILRLQSIREIRTELQQLSLALQAVRTGLESLDARTREAGHQEAEDARRLREDLLVRSDESRLAVTRELHEQQLTILTHLTQSRSQLQDVMNAHRHAFDEHQTAAMRMLHESLHQGFRSLHAQLGETLQRNTGELGRRVDALTQATDERLREISGQVDRRLAEGFEKTTATFADVLQRLALIDEAQKKITALSGEVVGLQQILADKRSRGAFGEVQLAALVRNVLPEAAFSLQHTLPNGRIADCVLFLPAPTGTLAIDAKFPLESYRRMTDFALGDVERKQAERQFKQDVRKHVRDIAERYILPNITSDGALMFIPAEAVFAEIQAHHPDVVDEAHVARVWLVSPTTLWAVLNTACAVLKDAATREQVDIIREHLGFLGKDFQRFRERMDQLARHIEQAHDDVQRVNISARRITDRFERIERVELAPAAERELENPVNIPGNPR